MAEPNAGRRRDVLHVAHTSVRYRPSETVFAQGDRCAAVMYIRKGRVKLTVTSGAGREAVVAVLHAGAFFGEGALAGTAAPHVHGGDRHGQYHRDGEDERDAARTPTGRGPLRSVSVAVARQEHPRRGGSDQPAFQRV